MEERAEQSATKHEANKQASKQQHKRATKAGTQSRLTLSERQTLCATTSLRCFGPHPPHTQKMRKSSMCLLGEALFVVFLQEIFQHDNINGNFKCINGNFGVNKLKGETKKQFYKLLDKI